jgi:putative transposase
VELLGPDGLLSQVTRAVLERALAEEMTGHLGYDKHDPAGRGSGNSRNGTTGKTVLTDIGRWTWRRPATGTGPSSRRSSARARPCSPQMISTN